MRVSGLEVGEKPAEKKSRERLCEAFCTMAEGSVFTMRKIRIC